MREDASRGSVFVRSSRVEMAQKQTRVLVFVVAPDVESEGTTFVWAWS